MIHLLHTDPNRNKKVAGLQLALCCELIDVDRQTDNALADPPPLPPKKYRSTNGHESNRKRDLNDTERALIRWIFIDNDGQFAYGQCSKDILPILGDDITPWQVSGFVSQLHVEVYKGLLKLKNPVAYYELMATKYPRVHERYMKKYGELVAQTNDEITDEPDQITCPACIELMFETGILDRRDHDVGSHHESVEKLAKRMPDATAPKLAFEAKPRLEIFVPGEGFVDAETYKVNQPL